MTTQKAYRLHAFGKPGTIHLDDVPVPTPGPSQVLVAVKAVGINPFDWKLRDGAAADFEDIALPVTIGADFVGTVVALGERASRFAVGDRVMTISTSLGACSWAVP